jgi:hypothetical protein
MDQDKKMSVLTKRVEYAMGAAEEGTKVLLVSADHKLTTISSHVIALLVAVNPEDIMFQRLPEEHRARALTAYEEWMAHIKSNGGVLGIINPVDPTSLSDLLHAVGNDYDLIMVC